MYYGPPYAVFDDNVYSGRLIMLFLNDCISYGLLNAGLYLFFLSRPQIMFIFYFHLHEKSTYAKLFLIFKKF